MKTIFLLLTATLPAGTTADDSAQLKLLSGQTIDGQLKAITADVVSIATDGATQAISLTDVLEILHTSQKTAAKQVQEVRLKDGSVLSCDTIRRAAHSLTAESSVLGSLTIPATSVAAVRLQKLDDSVAAQWTTFLGRNADKDLLVVPKRDGSGLDFLSGIVSSVSNTEISFLLDGDTIPVPAPRVFGIVFADNTESAMSASTAVTTISHDTLLATQVTVANEELQCRASWGQQLTLPLDAVTRIDLSRGRIHYLSDLKPIAENFMGIDPEGDLFAGLIDPRIARTLYGPARDHTIEGRSPLRLRGQTFARGLCIHSKTELVFALDRKYKSLEAIAGVDDQVAFNLNRQVLLIVSADGDELYRHTFNSQDDPVTLSIPVSDAQTLTILVDYADNNSQCDWLDLADARLILAPESN
jgi:NPCBM/NEW2 domain